MISENQWYREILHVEEGEKEQFVDVNLSCS